ncbi:hypothetical protein M409DRAFT_17630 [Zasmidium cellare ATCC 36951]|uniref:Mpv17/PMP22 family protein n=1 Tax=Zasmidium cellare ATCC 36951 TaxID=1080233 RepID=A0A6A6D419_ZASCE|nr:uncharacterized protein M409DRAFT_17630 [Zasmidium cellare ATCC 36951]KAF2172396.1 hypothetical protein M409DRAFT_17630 [Zasmidium cellare ATCC 36951]
MDSPIVTATWQAGALSALSNILAQFLTSWKTSSPFKLNTTDLFQFILFSVLSCPPNFIWQAWLESQFPAYSDKLPPSEKEALVDEVVTGDSQASKKGVNGKVDSKHTRDNALVDKQKSPRKLSIKNTAIKFALDQTVGATFNTVLFIAGIGLIRGQSLALIQQDVQEQFWPMIFAGQKLWPLVSILCFALIPLQYRMLVGNVAGVIWGIYLSLMVGEEK